MLHLLRLTFVVTLIFMLTGCYLLQPTAYFFISNISRDRKAVDIKVSIAGKTVFDDTIRYTGIQPDLSNTPYVPLLKGKYVIKVAGDNGQALAEQSIDLGKDKWIFISYSYVPAMDTAHANMLVRDFKEDSASVKPRVRGYPPNVTIHIMNKEPVHM